MEKFKEAYQENKKLFIGVGVAATALAAGAYFMRSRAPGKLKNPSPLFFQWKYDKEFVRENISLYKTEAMRRSELIKDVNYKLFLSYGLKEGFNGKLTTRFSLKSEDFKEEELFLDFQGKAIAGFEINGQEADAKFESQRVFLPKDFLRKGKNTITFKFKNTYVRNSSGLHWFQDPGDDRVYLFSHLEPFFCHRIFPCFDQPDLKAKLSLSVHCPIREWVAGGNGKFKERFDIDTDKGKQMIDEEDLDGLLKSKDGSFHLFDDSPLQSTYIYAFFAGEYHHWGNNDPEAPVPMKIFCRQSVKDMVPYKEQFRVVTEGMKFLGNYFDLKYPFDKYDQIFCPEFRISAMENIGAITFTERFLRKESERTSEGTTRHMYVVLHELSHMWFGDLVTMKWWEDLWLKESFADFMGALCITSVPALSNFKNAECFFILFKFIGLMFDSRYFTHSILAPIKHTEDATNVFDPISYDKGASFIRMASFMLGEKAMQEASSKYLNKYQYQNTELGDFIDCLAEAYEAHSDEKIDLRKWTDTWLKTKGLNILIPKITYSADGKTIEKFEIVQEFEKNSDEVYRSQKINIAFYDKDNNETKFTSILIRDQEVTEVEELQGKVRPEGILLNADNWGYCKIGFDQDSIDYFKKNTQYIQSDLNRNLIFRYLWEHYKSNQMRFDDYMTLIETSVVSESSMNAVVHLLTALQKQVKVYTPPGDGRDLLKRQAYDLTLELFKSKSDPQELNQIAEFVVSFIPDTETAVLFLEKGTVVGPSGAVVNADYRLTEQQRHSLVARIHSTHEVDSETQSKFLQENTKEKSFTEKLLEISCDCANPKNKEKWWNSFLDGTEYSKEEYMNAMHWFYSSHPESLMTEYADQFFDNLDEIFKTKHRDYAEVFITNLRPINLGRKQDRDRLQKLFDAAEEDRTHYRKMLMIAIEDLDDIISKREA